MQTPSKHPYNNQNFNTNHIGVSVPPGTLEEVVEWYGKHLGFRRLTSSSHEMGPGGKIYGSTLRKAKVAYLTTGNGVGFEIFEFIDPPTKAVDMNEWSLEEQYQRGGMFHLAITVPDPDRVCKECCDDGATQIGETIEERNGEKLLYLRDPWGMIVELLSCSWEQMNANAW
ncbi:hypothetical protein M409DRAFT_26037 [Zasmidium cellare ATCC 36951]|uniref:VOC domain-containing protein n=1 Tax=Zasmidium cellare ATCC 36951 TaxID=1080233 RepID=A0A6A6C9C4_ZASCE|nr:uncharacterized protein M409DRAFT_26037 [Zasmidium cellare ATCC 36951]KAF2163423.1 hypothetical protein M409DRAFT_26037 [Zasmidium cellare ATCC 36951]